MSGEATESGICDATPARRGTAALSLALTLTAIMVTQSELVRLDRVDGLRPVIPPIVSAWHKRIAATRVAAH